jgi:hypothetical protein
MKKDDLNSLLTYYSHISRSRNTSISIFFTLLIGWLALVYASIAQEKLLTFESKLVIASTLMIVTVYISLRVVNFGFILYRIESMVGLRKPIEEIGSNPKWLDKLNKRRKSLSYFSLPELLAGSVVCIFYLMTIWYTFREINVLLLFCISLFVFIFFLFHGRFKEELKY